MVQKCLNLGILLGFGGGSGPSTFVGKICTYFSLKNYEFI